MPNISDCCLLPSPFPKALALPLFTGKVAAGFLSPADDYIEKTLNLMRHIIEASLRSGDTMLDTFTGSGSTAIVCLELGQVFVGMRWG